MHIFANLIFIAFEFVFWFGIYCIVTGGQLLQILARTSAIRKNGLYLYMVCTVQVHYWWFYKQT